MEFLVAALVLGGTAFVVFWHFRFRAADAQLQAAGFHATEKLKCAPQLQIDANNRKIALVSASKTKIISMSDVFDWKVEDHYSSGGKYYVSKVSIFNNDPADPVWVVDVFPAQEADILTGKLRAYFVGPRSSVTDASRSLTSKST
jgi:hypothetical protein